MTLPPDDIIRVAEGDNFPNQPFYSNIRPDLLKDGSGDAVLGECGPGSVRNGSDGFDSHTYIGSGSIFEGQPDLPRTEVGDSIPRPVLSTENILANQIIGDKVYGTTIVRPRKIPNETGGRKVFPYSGKGVYVWGRFHIPDWVFLDRSYTKTGKFRFGLDKAGPDELFDRPKDNEWYAKIGSPPSSYWSFKLINFATCGFPFINGSGIVRTDYAHFTFLSDRLPNIPGGILGGPGGDRFTIPVINGDDISNARDFDGVSLNDRRVFLRMKDRSDFYSYYDRYWDTGLTLRDVFASGIFFQIDVVQKDGPDVPEAGLDASGLFFDVTYSIPQSGFEWTEEKRSVLTRCFNGGIYLKAISSYTKTYHQGNVPYEGVFIGSSEFETFDVCNQDPAWWINDVNAGIEPVTRKTIATLSWIQNLEVSNGDFADTSFLVVREFRHESSVGSLKKIVTAFDYGEPSIPTGETITVGDIGSGDVMKLILDNPAEETVEVTNVAFDDPWLKTVNDADPTLLPYTVVDLTFTLDDTVATGAVDITLTHDANNEFIPSPWTITLDAELGGGGPPE